MYLVLKCRKCEHNLYVEKNNNFFLKLSNIANKNMCCPSCGEEGYENWVLSHTAKEFPNSK